MGRQPPRLSRGATLRGLENIEKRRCPGAVVKIYSGMGSRFRHTKRHQNFRAALGRTAEGSCPHLVRGSGS